MKRYPGIVKSRPAPLITIRPIRRKGAAAIARMMSKPQAYHRDKNAVTSKTWIALLGTEPIGFVSSYDWIKMNFARPKFWRMLDLLYVEEKFRGLCIKESLVTKVVRDTIACCTWRLFTGTAKHNSGSNRFYMRLGFERRKSYSHSYII